MTTPIENEKKVEDEIVAREDQDSKSEHTTEAFGVEEFQVEDKTPDVCSCGP